MEEKKQERRRYGRLPLSEEAKRDMPVTAWFNKKELAQLDILCKAVHMRRGQLLRESALNFGDGVIKAKVPEINRQVYSELARSAANLNQIAHRLNMGDVLGIDVISQVLEDFRLNLFRMNNESESN
jgi:hypothetical protein